PFSLDPVSTPASKNPAPYREPGGAASQADPFSLDAVPSPDRAAEAARDKPSGTHDDFAFGPAATLSSANGASSIEQRERIAQRSQSANPWDLPVQPAATPASPRVGAAPKAAPALGAARPEEMALRAAFLHGMGVEEADFPGRDSTAEMEKFGREYRMMMEGLMQLLRKRAEEKGNARVAQTMVGASEVNPLKFLPTVDDAIITLIAERSPGFLGGEAAITDAVRDLAQHHVRAWRGIQTAMRRMIDRFDPVVIEEELKTNSAIGTLLSGGRGAK
ncbi:type VI secretion system-associated FHA domain protein TagH, partial [Mesorhizobium sp. M7A.F.Ca.US.001.02.1.1]|uniref:type VI secretion system-associated FHA domain protein TagH n=1 Tax=Mesorhizobium sp. M7A.F.Ca.US.001.02.1.1 TaxID=2496703 RepID=UPI000FD5C5BD